jgi:DNA repair protein SbcC/Rad50
MPAFKLKKIGIQGFRGFAKLQEIAFGTPLTLIHGGNRQGKSSIVNAIEWCLFGAEVAAMKYGDIRERDAWEVKNAVSPTCYVECVFQSDDGKIVTVKRTHKTSRTSDLSHRIDNGPTSTDEKQLHTLLRISAADYLSSVHLHPEVIRSLIIAKPKDRKEAIDRLLGLSELRDTLNAFAAEKPAQWTTALDQSLQVLDATLTTALSEKKRTIQTESSELSSKGVPQSDLTALGAQEYANKILSELNEFASSYHLSAPSIDGPTAIGGVQKFVADLPSAIHKLRNEHPVLADQGRFLIQKSTLEGLKVGYVSQQTAAADAERAFANYADKRTSDQQDDAIAAAKAEVAKADAEMREVSRNATILDSTLLFFEDRMDGEQITCPVCGETSRTVQAWRAHIQHEIEVKNLSPLKARKQDFLNQLASLEKQKEEKGLLQKRVASEQFKLSASVAGIEKAIGRSVLPSDDPSAILNVEITRLNDAIAGLQQQVSNINTSFDRFQRAVLDLDRFHRIGKAQQEMAKIEAIHEDDAYKQLKLIRKECEQYADDVELLIEGLKNTVTAEAEKRLAGVQAAISSTFTNLTNRADFPGLKVSPVGDGYSIELVSASGTTRPALPLLNHADLNCAALSIFLALASSAQISHEVGIVILDDSSQSLDAACKKSLCSVLSLLCEARQVIVATADDDLRDEVMQMTKAKIAYGVKDWSPTGGPTIDVDGPAAVHAV